MPGYGGFLIFCKYKNNFQQSVKRTICFLYPDKWYDSYHLHFQSLTVDGYINNGKPCSMEGYELSGLTRKSCG